MAASKEVRNKALDQLFDAVLTLKNKEDCYTFFKDLCTMKELNDMAQRFTAACLLLDGKTYEQIVKEAEITEATGLSTATISRINRCIQYGEGGYELAHDRLQEND